MHTITPQPTFLRRVWIINFSTKTIHLLLGSLRMSWFIIYFIFLPTDVACPASTAITRNGDSISFASPTITFPNNALERTLSYSRNGAIFAVLNANQQTHTLNGFPPGTTTTVTVGATDTSRNSAQCSFQYTNPGM